MTSSATTGSTASSKGLLAAGAAFAVWGVFPLYFHPLRQIGALQIIADRIVLSFVFMFAWMTMRGELRTIRVATTTPGVFWRLALSATLITINWITYVWAVNNGHVVETSLGYFIGPLVNVLLGVVLLSERLSSAQWIAVALAACGVAYLTLVGDQVPWIALILAVSFGSYGLVRKLVRVEALPGLATETLILVPFAAAELLWCEMNGSGALGHSGLTVQAMLIGSGPLTAITLFLYAFGTRLLPYSTVGLLQYIAPMLQLACGIYAFHEPFDRARVLGFGLIWSALVIYAGEGLWRSRRSTRTYA